jgi:enoyl-CoA hydratase/carnithine racemase
MTDAHARVVMDERGIATRTLVNVKSANIVGTPAIESLCLALSRLVQDPALRVLVLRCLV